MRVVAWAEGAIAVGVAVAGRGGIATAGGAAEADEVGEGATGGGVAIATGIAGAFGGITTTDGGRRAATDAGVTSLGAGGSMGRGAAGLAVAAGASSLASIDGAATGFATVRTGGRSAASLLLGDGTKDVAGARDIRQIDLRFDLFFAVGGGARGLTSA